MRAAIYCRKSTEQNVSEDAKSVTRQAELARAFAEKHGWTVDPAHVYTDDGVSGAEFEDRPGLAKLLLAAQSTPCPFDVLVTMDGSRLGRDQWRTGYVLQQIADEGLQVWFYQENRKVESDHAMGKFMENVAGFAAEMEREKGRARTREATRAKAARGYVAGGKVLGYRNVRDGSNVRRVVDEEQAAIVRRIFTMAAEGKGLLKIAKALNAEGIVNPTGQDRLGSKKAGKWWASTGIREILHRELYCGRVVWGQTTKKDRKGTRARVAVPEPEWLVREEPELRIVSEELWQAVQARLANAHRAYLRRNDGQLNGKPESGLESKYLLSGFLRCKVCGGLMQINKRTSRRGRPQLVYICSTHRTRGSEACPEKGGVLAASIHEAVVYSLRKVLTPEALDGLLKSWAEAQPDHEAKRRPLEADLARVDAELRKLADAVAGGATVQTLLDAIKAREAEKRELLARLEHLDALAKVSASYDVKAHLAAWKAFLPSWNEALVAEGPAGRQRIRSLLTGPIFVSRGVDGTWMYEGEGTVVGVFKGWLGLRITDEELEEMNALADKRNAKAVPLADEVNVAMLKPRSMAGAEGAMSTFDPQPPGSTILEPSSGQVHYQWCPRGDSNTRPAV